MKSIFTLSVFLVLTVSSYAQEDLVKKGSFYKDFRPGHYYTTEGKKVSGLIKLTYAPNAFGDRAIGDSRMLYKASEKAKKEKLTTAQVQSFVVGTDSFAVIKNFRPNQYVKYQREFARIMIPGKLSLVVFYTEEMVSMQVSQDVWYWVLSNDEKAEAVYSKKKHFVETLTKYIEDYPELLQRVTQEELTYENLREIVVAYNQHFSGK